jgi:hypothetical protein
MENDPEVQKRIAALKAAGTSDMNPNLYGKSGIGYLNTLTNAEAGLRGLQGSLSAKQAALQALKDRYGVNGNFNISQADESNPYNQNFGNVKALT